MKRILSILVLALLAFAKADAHNVQYYTTCGYVCAGSSMTVDAQIANAGSGTRYAWQYKDNSGTWKCFVNGSNTINGTSFTVSGATANGVANDAPLLTIQLATTALENVQVRVLMTDGGDPCATSPSYSVWGGDADPDNKYMSLRLHVLSGSDCSTISTYCAQGGCNGNTMNDANGYYGGFESSNNWSSASTEYTSGGTAAGRYSILNNVRTIQSGFPAFAPRSGNYMMYVDGSTTANAKVWYKSVSVTAGSTYQFSAWVANANNASTNLPYISLIVDGSTVATGTVTSVAGDWDFVQGTYDATVTGTITIQIVDNNIQSGNNDFVLDDICFKSIGSTVLTCASGYFNPVAGAEGFNVFVRNGINFQAGHSDGAVAMGGDATLNGLVSIAEQTAGAYPYGAGNVNNYGLVVGGKITYSSGNQSKVLNGFLRLGNTTNSRLFYVDCNNANTNLRLSPYNADCNTSYNTNPQLQMNTSETNGSATDPHNINFTTAYTTLQNSANKMVFYTASSSCSNNLNIIALGTGNQSITLVDNKINVINIAASSFDDITGITFTNAPSATKPLVFNIDGTGSLTWAAPNVAGLGGSNGAYVIYNFYNNSGTITLTGANTVYGTVFAPSATFVKNHTGNIEGQVIASSFTMNGGEVHYQPFNVCLPECSTTCNKTTETIPNQFNTGFAASLSNSTFVGSSGTWTASSNANATIVCVQPYYTPNGNAIKIVNWNTSGKTAGTCSATSPKVDLTNACCPTELTFNFTLWTYACVSGDVNASLNVDFSSDNGSTWTNVWTKTSAQLFALYGANGKTGIVVTVPTGYQTANFKYRFRGEMSGNNANNFYQFIDDIYVSSPTTCTASLTLGNLVWLDTDNDGLKDANESVLSGFTVKLYKDSNSDNVPDGAAIATTTTNASGIYQFTGLTADKYIVAVVMQTGYTVGATITSSTNPNNDTDNDNNGITLVSGEVRSNYITLTSGGEPTSGYTNNTLDFGLKGTGSIGDYVWADYNGDGIQTAGEPPLEGVVVTITYPDGTTKSTTTNASGNYLFSNLGPGTYNVNFVSPVGATPSPASQGTDVTKDSDPVADNVTVVLAAGQNRTDIDAGFVCCTETLSLGELLWIDANGNGIKDASETGYSGATVKLYRDNNGDNIPDAAAVATTTTNTSGIYNFNNLPAGKYIVGVTIPSGYMASSTTGTSATPDNDIETDNNGVTVVSSELRSNYITLTSSNFTLNFAIRTTGTGAGSIGNYVWNDLNLNGLQDAGEPAIANATVSLTYPSSSVVSTTTDANGFYIFNNLSAGTYTVTFTTPAGMLATSSNQGSDDTKDSDPVSGTVSVVLTSNQNRTDIDAGFYLKSSTSSSCGTGYVTKNTTLITNGSFATTSLSPGSGNSFSGSCATTGLTYTYSGGNFKAQAQYSGNNVPANTERSFSLISNAGTYTYGSVVQAPFPGDPTNKVAANTTFMYHNGNDLGCEALVWEQTVTGLVIGKTYRFRAYVSNLINDAGLGYDDPIVKVRTGGTTGLPDGTIVVAATTLTEVLTANSAALNGWKRLEYAFTATGTSMTFKITDAQTSTNGDDLGLTAIGIDVCEKDTDGDGLADIDDIDSDNDGILNTVESAGYNPFGDGDADGTLNYKDATPGVTGLTWTDCNSDGINDLFDFDGDGIINALDLDSDNDGIPDIDETRDVKATDNNNDGMADGVDADGDGLMSTADANDAIAGGPGLTPQDMDRDGKPNYLDLDSDGDGLTDLSEATGVYDADGIASGTDADADGLKGGYTNSTTVADNYNGFGGRGITPIDTDNDGKPDMFDVDSDNDGIPDNVEAQATCSYKLPTGTDTDGDGVDNAYDLASSSCNKTSAGLTPFDKDADGVADYLDQDADNDGAPDVNEASGIAGNTFITNKNDTDGDGLYDFFDGLNILTATSNYHYNVTNSNMGPLGGFDGPAPSASKVELVKSVPGDCSVNDRDWRECIILPVTLVEFKGNLNNSTTKLMWKVTNEINMNYYDIERSTDGVNFTKVNTVSATNSSVSSTVTSYSLNDDISSISSTVVYYRLKMMEKSGKAKNSNIVSFKLGKAKSGIVVNPNPAVSFFNLKITTTKDAVATIRVMDLSGKLMIMQNNKVMPGTNAFLFNNLSNFSAGTYNVQVMIDGEVFNEKLIVTK
jgi:choice-of-anchor A domain-containing protein